jgi:NADH-quinone oxidoreductase subunit J
MITQYLFYFLSFVAITSALFVIFTKNPVYSVLSLIVTFFSIAGHYFLMNAQFLAAVHVIVYAGAIMVLFLYVIMMLNLNKEAEPHKDIISKAAAGVAGGLLLLTMIAALSKANYLAPSIAKDDSIGLVGSLGKTLFGEFLLPFEVSSILFLAAMVGAVMLSKKEIH